MTEKISVYITRCKSVRFTNNIFITSFELFKNICLRVLEKIFWTKTTLKVLKSTLKKAKVNYSKVVNFDAFLVHRNLNFQILVIFSSLFSTVLLLLQQGLDKCCKRDHCTLPLFINATLSCQGSHLLFNVDLHEILSP